MTQDGTQRKARTRLGPSKRRNDTRPKQANKIPSLAGLRHSSSRSAHNRVKHLVFAAGSKALDELLTGSAALGFLESSDILKQEDRRTEVKDRVNGVINQRASAILILSAKLETKI